MSELFGHDEGRNGEKKANELTAVKGGSGVAIRKKSSGTRRPCNTLKSK